jgi:hypothetical protein
MKKIILLFVFVWSSNSKAQTKNADSLNLWDNINGWRFAGGYYDNLELETSFLITSYPEQEQGFGGMGMRVQYVGAGLEYLLIDNKHVFGTKLSYENSLAFFSGQIATDFLFTDESTQIRIMPKVGLSVFGRATLYYGWNIQLLKESDLQTQNHVVSFQMNILD